MTCSVGFPEGIYKQNAISGNEYRTKGNGRLENIFPDAMVSKMFRPFIFISDAIYKGLKLNK